MDIKKYLNVLDSNTNEVLQLIKKNLIIGSFGLASHLLIKYRQQKRSRDNECEADDFALRYTNLAQELRDGITFLDDQSVELKGFIERLFASHPSTKLRKEKIEKRLAEILGQPKS